MRTRRTGVILSLMLVCCFFMALFSPIGAQDSGEKTKNNSEKKAVTKTDSKSDSKEESDILTEKRRLAKDYIKRGEAAFRLKNPQASKRFFDLASKTDPTWDVPHIRLAEWHKRYLNKDRAILEYQKAIELNNRKPDNFLSLAEIYIDQQDYDKARDNLQRARELDPENPKLFYQLAQTYRTQYVKVSKNKAYKEEAEQLRSKAKENFSALVQILDRDEAWKEDKKLKDMYFNSRRQLAVFLADEQNYDEALKHFEFILKSDAGPSLKQSVQRDYELVQKQKNQKRNFYVAVGGSIFLLVIIFVAYRFMVVPQQKKTLSSKLPSSASDSKNYNQLGVFAVQHLKELTKMPKSLVYFVERDDEQPKLAVADNLDKDKFKGLEVNYRELDVWLNSIQGKPFVYEKQKREPQFHKVFPNIKELLKPAAPRIGVPFLYQNTFRGIAFMCFPQLAEKKFFKNLFKKNAEVIRKIALEVGIAADRILRHELSISDTITPAYNQLHFKEKLPEVFNAVKSRSKHLSILMLECDGMEAILKRFGEERKNYVLSTVVDHIKDTLDPKKAMIFRVSDYRFALILLDYNAIKAKEAAKKFGELVADVRFTTPIPNITASMGLSVYPDHAPDVKNLEAAARTALDKAIKTGRNKIVIESESDFIVSSDNAINSTTLIQELKSAGSGSLGSGSLAKDSGDFSGSDSGVRKSISIAPPLHTDDDDVRMKPRSVRSTPKEAPPKPAEEIPELKEKKKTTPLTFRSAQKKAPKIPAKDSSKKNLRESLLKPKKKAGLKIRSASKSAGPSGADDKKAAPPVKAEVKKPAEVKAPPVRDKKGFAPIRPGTVRQTVTKTPAGAGGSGKARDTSHFKPGTEVKPPEPQGRKPKMREVGSSTSKLPPLPKASELKKPMMNLIRRSKTPTQVSALRRRTAPGRTAFMPGAASTGTRPAPTKGYSSKTEPLKSRTGGLAPKKIDVKFKPTGSGSMPTPKGPKKVERKDIPVSVQPSQPPIKTTRTGPKTIDRTPTPAPPKPKRMPSAPIGTAPLPRLGMKSIKPTGPRKMPGISKITPAKSRPAPPAAKDPVTGFFYKSYFEQSIKGLIVRANQTKRPLALLFFKLDKHKELKGKYGQEKLNNVLKEITVMIQNFLKEGSDVPARYSDEIFVIILPDTSFQIAFNLAEQIRFTIGNLSFRDIPGQITLSLGIASFPDKGKSPKEVMKNSYDAMVYAIKQGGNRSLIWQENLLKKK